MSSARFHRYQLRTTDVAAARAFYEELLEQGSEDVEPLPELARARGAVPHWLGHVATDDVLGLEQRLLARGAVRLGPAASRPEDRSVLRDPGGAVVGLSRAVADRPRSDVVWHQLFAKAAARVASHYAELLGWALLDPVDVGDPGEHRPFSWQSGGPAAGAFTEVDEARGIHPHWMFFFRVASLGEALELVRRRAGRSLEAFQLRGGARCAACEDPQGAAFGLWEPPVA